MGYVKILTDQYPQAILRHIWETSKNAEFFFLKNYPPAQQKPFLKIQRGGAFGSEKNVFAVQGGNFSKKKILRFWKSLKYV